jgi:hypothetical protein
MSGGTVLEITVSFLGIHKREPDIYIGFSPALPLQWYLAVVSNFVSEYLKEKILK